MTPAGVRAAVSWPVADAERRQRERHCEDGARLVVDKLRAGELEQWNAHLAAFVGSDDARRAVGRGVSGQIPPFSVYRVGQGISVEAVRPGGSMLEWGSLNSAPSWEVVDGLSERERVRTIAQWGTQALVRYAIAVGRVALAYAVEAGRDYVNPTVWCGECGYEPLTDGPIDDGCALCGGTGYVVDDRPRRQLDTAEEALMRFVGFPAPPYHDEDEWPRRLGTEEACWEVMQPAGPGYSMVPCRLAMRVSSPLPIGACAWMDDAIKQACSIHAGVVRDIRHGVASDVVAWALGESDPVYERMRERHFPSLVPPRETPDMPVLQELRS